MGRGTKFFEKCKAAFSLLSSRRYTTIAGTLCFFLILSLVPFVFWLTLLFGSSALDAVASSGIVMFQWAEELLRFLKENAEGTAATSVLFLATTLWSSTGFFYHLRRSGEIVYACRRTKKGWKVRLSALLYTFGVLLFFAAAASILAGASALSSFLPAFLSYPIWYLLALGIGFLAAWILNSYICPYRCRPSDTAAGSLLTAILWLVASGAFSLYLHLGSLDRLYGALTLIVVFLLWLYWMMIVFAAGAILCSVRVKRSSPPHKTL